MKLTEMNIEKIKVSSALVIFSSILSLLSAYLLIFIYDKALFQSQDTIKLILLSGGICGPFFSINILIVVLCAYRNVLEKQNSLLMPIFFAMVLTTALLGFIAAQKVIFKSIPVDTSVFLALCGEVCIYLILDMDRIIERLKKKKLSKERDNNESRTSKL